MGVVVLQLHNFLDLEITEHELPPGIHERRVAEVDSGIKGSILYLAKSGSDNLIFSFVAARTNLIPSYYLTCTEGGVASNGFEVVSLSGQQPQTPLLQE